MTIATVAKVTFIYEWNNVDWSYPKNGGEYETQQN